MEIDSKPEALDRLERRLIQLRIEREAVRKEKDEASQKRFALIESEIEKLQKQVFHLEEEWKAEKAEVQGTRTSRRRSRRSASRWRTCSARASTTAWRSCSTESFPNWRINSSKPRKNNRKQSQAAAHAGRRGGDRRGRVSGHRYPGIQDDDGEREKLIRMEERLHERVVGQDEAVRLVADAIRRSRSGLSDRTGPMDHSSSWGPPGSQDRALQGARRLPLRLGRPPDPHRHVEYMEKHSVSRLIGRPPGYVGYDEGGQLTEQVRRKPYSVILFDEIEKAHPDVFNTLLQVLDEVA